MEIAISSGVIAPRSSPAGALSLAKRSAETPCSASFAFSASAFLAADERQVFCVNRKRRQQRSFIAAALRRDHDIAFAGFLDRQCIAFDAPINLVERRLLDWWCADGHGKTHPLCKIGDRNGHRARSTNDDLGARQHWLAKYVHPALAWAHVLGNPPPPFLLAGLVAVLIQPIERLD